MKFCVLLVVAILRLAVAGESESEPYNEYDNTWLKIALGKWTMNRCTEEIIVIVIVIIRCEYEFRGNRI